MEEQLLQLAQQFLFSDAGKKLVGDIDLDSMKNQILQSTQEKYSSLSETNTTPKTNLTREERKTARQDQRTQNKKDREKRREEKKATLKENGGIVGQFIPEFREYTIKGRLIDKITQEPLAKIDVQPLITEPIYLPFGKKVITQSDGTFIINIKLPVLPYNNKILVKPLLLYTKSPFLPATQEIMTLDREIKSDLNILPLLNIEKAAKEQLSAYIDEVNDKIQDINELALSAFEKVIIARRKSIMKVVNIIQNRLFPLALTLLIAFGISKLTQKNQKICPSNDLLLSNLARRNRIVKQLNQIFKALALNSAIAAALVLISNQFKAGRLQVSNLPLPLSVPPGIGVPYSTVSKFQQIESVLKELEDQNKELNKQILIALIFLVGSLTAILLLLKGIDELTQECITEQNLDLVPFSQELLDLVEEAKEEGIDNGIRVVNGFIIEIQTVTQGNVGSLKRKQAVGKNAQGVILVKGDESFSSSDQILINELAFYIQSNNLKAY